MPTLALATCKTIPEPDPDEKPLLDACIAAGFDAEMVGWDDSAVDWSRFDLVVPRSTWNYYEKEAAFRDWVAKVSHVSTLWNPAELILRTIDKRYLLELESKGIPVVPTRLVDSPEELEGIIDECGWTEFVLKPTVSAASYMTLRFTRDQMCEAGSFVEEILKTHKPMAQKYLPRVAEGGEINIVHIDGQLSHGVVKYPRFHGGVEWVADAVSPTTPEQEELANRVVATVSEPWLYARVDLMEDDDGSWLLSELELIEPSLFFVQHPPAMYRFVEAMKRLCR